MTARSYQLTLEVLLESMGMLRETASLCASLLVLDPQQNGRRVEALAEILLEQGHLVACQVRTLPTGISLAQGEVSGTCLPIQVLLNGRSSHTYRFPLPFESHQSPGSPLQTLGETCMVSHLQQVAVSAHVRTAIGGGKTPPTVEDGKQYNSARHRWLIR